MNAPTLARAYAYSEIEAMRRALSDDYPDGVSYRQDQRSREVEDRLRTAIAAGIDPQELLAACRQRIAQRWAAAATIRNSP